MRNGMALREVGRYYDAAKGDRDITFEALKRTCVFRQQYRINLIRSCFGDSLDYKDDKDTRLAENYRALIYGLVGAAHVCQGWQNRPWCLDA